MVVILINGMGRCGKDYLISHMKFTTPYSISYIQSIKDIASVLGYEELRKNDKDRDFLHKLKILTDEYSDFCFTETLKNVSVTIELDLDQIIFIHIGEMKDIIRIKEAIISKYTHVPVYTLWIESDDNVVEDDPRFDANEDSIDPEQYDYIFNNHKDQDSVKRFDKFINEIVTKNVS